MAGVAYYLIDGTGDAKISLVSNDIGAMFSKQLYGRGSHVV